MLNVCIFRLENGMISQPVVDTETMDSSSDSGIDFQYRNKRERNNVAVRQSRMKMKNKMNDSTKRIMKLRKEKENLQQHLDFLKNRCSQLKKLILNIQSNKVQLTKEKIEEIRTSLKNQTIVNHQQITE